MEKTAVAYHAAAITDTGNKAATATAVAYYRTSSATGVGEDKDSLTRQQAAVARYATGNSITVVGEYYDAAVSGCDPVDTRAGFRDMLSYMTGNGATIVLVETANRFARDLMVQETGYAMLKKMGYSLIAVDDPDAFTNDTPTAVMIRQILGAVSQFERATIQARLDSGRARKRALTGRCEGRPQAPADCRAAAVRLKAQGLSLRAIATALVDEGFKQYGPESVKRMIG